MTEFPSRWEIVPLADLMHGNAPIIYGILQPGPNIDAGVLYVRPTEIVDDEIRINRLRRTSLEIAAKYDRAKLAEGDVLLSIVGTVGKVAIVPAQLDGANITQSSVRLRVCPEHVENSYVAWFLRSPAATGQYKKRLLGTGVPRLNVAHVRELHAPVAPLNEQRRIVAKIESLFERSRRAKQALDAIPPLLDKLRQSILAAAFRGDLTADWRAQNPDAEPAYKLLERIRAERRRRWEEAELAKMRAKGKEPKNDTWKAKYKEPEPVDCKALPELPAGWCWSKLDELVAGDTSLCYGVVQPGPEAAGGVPLVRVLDISDGAVKVEQLRTISKEVGSQYQRTKLVGGELLVSVVGTIGRVAVASDALAGANIARAIAKATLASDVSAYWVSAWLNTPIMQDTLVRGAREVARKTLNIDVLRHTPVPLAPAGEAGAIARQLEVTARQLRALGDACEAAEARHAALDRAILAKAFQGELVEQDPNDEPASVLLERIRAAREAAAPARKTRVRRVGGGKKAAQR